MNFLFFDCETTGKPLAYGKSYTDIDNWPRVTQLAWILADRGGNTIAEQQALVYPDGWEIPKEQFFLDNNMSTERSRAEGIPVLEVLNPFIAAKHQADYLVAHNMAFDHPVVWAEILRHGLEPRTGMIKICTMVGSTKYCGIPQKNGRKGVKWPTLDELHQVLFGKSFEGAHDAAADIRATKDCFFELVRLGVINPETITNKGVRA